jgi:hypothetical protein
VWDAIEELEPTVESDSYQGNLLLVFLDGGSSCDMSLHALLEKKFSLAPGGRDLRFAFAFRSEHEAHHKRFRIAELPAAVFVREGVEIERCDDADDIIEMARDIIRRYS